MSRKKRKKKNKKRFKQKGYENLNISPIQDYSIVGGKLQPPLNKLGDVKSLISWRDNALNEILWAAIIRTQLNQEESLKIFRSIISSAKDQEPRFKETFISHSALSALSDEEFDGLMSPVINNDKAKETLSALLYISTLPDYAHWERHLKPVDPEMHSEYLMKAIAICTDHQSQEATDIRWLKVVFFAIVQERLQFPTSMNEKVEELRLYPEYGDQRSVRPSIRSMEMMLRMKEKESDHPPEIPDAIADKVPAPWSEAFWKECFDITPCMPGSFEKPVQKDNSKYIKEILFVYHALSEHFINNSETTDLDARRDGAYGLTFYALYIGLALARNNIDCRAEGRHLLRTIVECYITLKYLASEDTKMLWEQFRHHGTGQTKLAFLKNVDKESVPEYINLDDLYNYANEDIWQEYLDIGIKPWADKNMRAMAIGGGIKDVYDKYYDWPSAYIHGNWGAIRDTVFTVCLNPLHRFHRIPLIPRFEMPSTLPDAVEIINMMLEVNHKLYPDFKHRINISDPLLDWIFVSEKIGSDYMTSAYNPDGLRKLTYTSADKEKSLEMAEKQVLKYLVK